jgi:ABC-type lipoprotein release transport system permease subunit
VLPETGSPGLGEEAALILRRIEAGSFTERGEARMIARFKVIGLYGTAMSGSFGDGAVAYCPLGAMRSLLASNGFFRFAIRSFSFVLRDSRDVSRFKQVLVRLSLDSDKSVRAAVDDRILQGTVAPIEKNIALLRGVQTLLFALVTGMGFLLCFLFARGRQSEFAVMRMLGENPLLLMFGTLAEQAVLCVCGAGLGTLPVLLIAGGRDAIDWRILALFISCYLAGAAVAALLGAHGRPMMLLKGRE